MEKAGKIKHPELYGKDKRSREPIFVTFYTLDPDMPVI